jgi:uncharacterized protein (TIGR02996 family)
MTGTVWVLREAETPLRTGVRPEAPVDDRAVLLANVLTVQADDTARLVLADWLDEHGEEAFGRFIRAGVCTGRYGSAVGAEDTRVLRVARRWAGVERRGDRATRYCE